MSFHHHALDAIFGARARVRLLRVLLPLGRPVSGRQAARLARVPVATAARALDDLVTTGTLTRREATGQNLFEANRESELHGPLLALFDAERLRVARMRTLLVSAFADGYGGGEPLPLRTLALFGSVARGEDDPESDLDVLALVDAEAEVDAAYDRLTTLTPELTHRYGARLSPIVMTSSRFAERHAQGDPFTRHVVRDAEVLFGRHPREVDHG